MNTAVYLRLRPTHTSKFFDVRDGTLEFRRNEETGTVSGHFMSWDGRTYHNTSNLVVDQMFQERHIKELMARALGDVNDRDVSDAKIAITGLPCVRAFLTDS